MTHEEVEQRADSILSKVWSNINDYSGAEIDALIYLARSIKAGDEMSKGDEKIRRMYNLWNQMEE